MFSSSNILSLVAVIGLLITAAAVIGGSFRVSRNTATVARYKEAADSWEAKASAQGEQMEEMRAEVSRLREANITKDATIGEMQGRIDVLQEMVTGKTALETIAAEQAQFTAIWESRSAESLAQISAIRGETRAIHERLDAMSAQLGEANGRRTASS